LHDFLKHLNICTFFSKITHLFIAFMTWSTYCAKRHQHWFHLTSSQLTALTSTLSTTASGMCTAACIPEAGERCWPTEAMSDWDLVWRTADCCCRWSHWRMETPSPGLCPCRRASFWTFVVMSTVVCLLLTFSR